MFSIEYRGNITTKKKTYSTCNKRSTNGTVHGTEQNMGFQVLEDFMLFFRCMILPFRDLTVCSEEKYQLPFWVLEKFMLFLGVPFHVPFHSIPYSVPCSVLFYVFHSIFAYSVPCYVPGFSNAFEFAKEKYFNGYPDPRSVQENFNLITSFIQDSADKHIPPNTSRTVSTVP